MVGERKALYYKAYKERHSILLLLLLLCNFLNTGNLNDVIVIDVEALVQMVWSLLYSALY